jgi:hypothetical protein
MLRNKGLFEQITTKETSTCRAGAPVTVRRWSPLDAPATSIIWKQVRNKAAYNDYIMVKVKTRVRSLSFLIYGYDLIACSGLA